MRPDTGLLRDVPATDVAAAPADVPGWVACRGCRAITYGKRYERNLRVCPGCGNHDRLTAPQRLAQLLDRGSIEPLDHPVPSWDPLGFVDSRPYPERLAEARTRTGLDEAVLCARGTIEGWPVIVAVMDFRFLGGSLGSGVGERITRAAETAREERTPLLLVTASGGARMQEGAISLMQMAKTAAALTELDEAGILTITLVTDPTYGGVAASFATLTDVIVAEPGARMGFAGPRVIEQTIRQTLPDGFQTAEYLLDHGLIDAVQPRSGLRGALARLLSIPQREPRLPEAVDAPVVRDPGRLHGGDPWETAQLARHIDRPTTLDHLSHLLDGFQELRGDRAGSDCPSIVGGLGWLDGLPVMAVGHQKGHSTHELVARNFGMPTPAGYRKAARLFRLAAKLDVPVVTLIDTPGAYPGLEAEEHGQAIAIAESLRLLSGLQVPVVAVVTGEGGSGGALALAVADRVLMFEHATYSVISPEGCAAILWKSPDAAPEAAAALRVDAASLLAHGIVDGVIREPVGGAHADPVLAADHLRAAVTEALRDLVPVPRADLVRERRRRFRGFGAPDPDALLAAGGEDLAAGARR